MPTKTNVFLVILFVIFRRADFFENVPPSRQIQVVEGEEYTFGVDDDWADPTLELCYYKTDTGLQGSFKILPHQRRLEPNATKTTRELQNIITTLGTKNLCQINVKKVNATGPTKWTLTLGESKTHNITSIDFFVNFFFLRCVECIGTKQLQCILQGDGLLKHISSLGRGLCGLKYENAVFDDISYIRWNISAQDNDGKWYRGQFRTSVVSTFGIYYVKKTVVLGSPVTINCGEQFEQTFCTLFNPKGEVIVTENCLYGINSFGVHHLGQWKCYSGNPYSLDTLEYVIDYVRTENPKLLPVIEETKTEITIGCKVDSYRLGAYTYCKLTAPNQKTFNVKPGAATERYTTIGTKFNEGVCLVQIKKPLQSFENGYWRCQIIGPYQNDFGGVFLKLGKAERPTYKTRHTLKVELYKSFGVYCEVPYVSDYCYVKSPNGTIFKNRFHKQVNIGRCSLMVESALPSDNGTWICYFARDTGVPSEEIVVEVVISDILHSYESVEVDAGGTAQLLCTSDGLPLSYCEFIAPNGTAYFIKKQDTTSNVRYYGKGLEYGDCGISLVNAGVESNGIWTCVVRFVRDEKQDEMTAKINLIVEPSKTPSRFNVAGLGIGLSVGIVVSGSIVSIFVFKRWRRKQHAEINRSVTMRPRTDPDNTSDHSDIVLQNF
ncbi:hypothetical protein RN001_015459 [Aquatica leii]|uniref:Ig-like domain-containing protein n=1 Tax=Aquatica leii TaxID=1421715 RepID=A0AAN7NVN2_9COLE|nr:hypothetical protein RN001_015459 [Aquatica leii]